MLGPGADGLRRLAERGVGGRKGSEPRSEPSWSRDVYFLATVRTDALVLPAASRTVTVMTVVPETGIAGVLQVVVPNAVPAAPLSVAHMTCVTPTLSDAVPATVMLDAAVVSELAVVGV